MAFLGHDVLQVRARFATDCSGFLYRIRSVARMTGLLGGLPPGARVRPPITSVQVTASTRDVQSAPKILKIEKLGCCYFLLQLRNPAKVVSRVELHESFRISKSDFHSADSCTAVHTHYCGAVTSKSFPQDVFCLGSPRVVSRFQLYVPWKNRIQGRWSPDSLDLSWILPRTVAHDLPARRLGLLRVCRILTAGKREKKHHAVGEVVCHRSLPWSRSECFMRPGILDGDDDGGRRCHHLRQPYLHKHPPVKSISMDGNVEVLSSNESISRSLAPTGAAVARR